VPALPGIDAGCTCCARSWPGAQRQRRDGRRTIRTIFGKPGAVHVAEQLDVIAATPGREFPNVEEMLHKAANAITADAAFPVARRKKISSTNPLERLNKEIK
jgi:transposase-like protein